MPRHRDLPLARRYARRRFSRGARNRCAPRRERGAGRRQRCSGIASGRQLRSVLRARRAEFGIAANIEPMPWTDCKDFASGVRIVRAAGRDNAGVLIDPIHFDRGGSEVGEIAAVALSAAALPAALRCAGAAAVRSRRTAASGARRAADARRRRPRSRRNPARGAARIFPCASRYRCMRWRSPCLRWSERGNCSQRRAGCWRRCSAPGSDRRCRGWWQSRGVCSFMNQPMESPRRNHPQTLGVRCTTRSIAIGALAVLGLWSATQAIAASTIVMGQHLAPDIAVLQRPATELIFARDIGGDPDSGACGRRRAGEPDLRLRLGRRPRGRPTGNPRLCLGALAGH